MAFQDHFRWLRSVWTAPGNRGQRLTALGRAAFWFVHRRLRPRHPVIRRVFGGMKFACHADSYMGKHVHYFSDYADYDNLHFMAEYLRSGDAFLDIGANAGLYTVLAGSLVQGGPIYCVEPQPRNLQILHENIILNGLKNVTVLPIAASDEEGELLLTGHDVFAGPAYEGAPTGVQHHVPMVKLDDTLPPLAFALTKIDVEGYEWPVLRGLQRALTAGRLPVVLFELNGCLRRYGFMEDDFCNWLSGQGYTLATYHHDGRILRCAKQPRGDVLALSESGLQTLRERYRDLEMVD